MNPHRKVSPSDCETEQKLMVEDRGMQMQDKFFEKQTEDPPPSESRHALLSASPGGTECSVHFMQQTMKTMVNTVNSTKEWMEK